VHLEAVEGNWGRPILGLAVRRLQYGEQWTEWCALRTPGVGTLPPGLQGLFPEGAEAGTGDEADDGGDD